MPSIDFSLRDGSSQTINLTNISDIIYITYSKPDGSTVNVPISFMFSSINEKIVVDDFITHFSTTCLNNENSCVLRESGYRIDDIFVVPEFADKRAKCTLYFCKSLCYNISGKDDECIEVSSGCLPKGLELKTNDNGNFIIEGYATKDNICNNYSCRLNFYSQTTNYSQMVETQNELKFDEIYKSREIEFRNIQYTSGSTPFCATQSITDTVTNDSSVLKCIETYVTNGETRTRIFFDELKDDCTLFKYNNERIKLDIYGCSSHNKTWKGILLGCDGCSCATYDEVRVKYQSSVSENDYQECNFTLGLCSASSDGYFDTNDYTICVRRNYDELRDELLIPVPYGNETQTEYSGINHDSVYYYYGDTPKASFLALFLLPITKNDGTIKNISIRYGELELTRNDSIDSQISIDNSNIVFTRNVSGNSLLSTIELNTENV